METVYKTYRAEVKEVNPEEGIIDLLIPISSNQVDRDGEVIEPTAFKKTLPKFMKHPVLVASHDYRDLTNQIGAWTKLKIEPDGVSGSPQYYVNAGNEQADWAYYLASKGVAAFSVGFIPKSWEDGEGTDKSPRRTYKEVELLEISQVIIPSNRQAVQSMRSKSVDPVITELCDEVEKELSEVVTKPEETGTYYRVPVPGEEGKHEGHKIRTMDVSREKGIKSLYCTEEKKIITYMFDKEKWGSMEECQDWVKEHMGKTASSVSQKEILDQIDYLKTLLKQAGSSDQVMLALHALSGNKVKMGMAMMRQMQQMHDMMADCTEKAARAQQMSADMMDDMEAEEDMEYSESNRTIKTGAVLNKRNKDRLAQIKRLAQEVLDSAGMEDEEERSQGDDMPFEKNNKDKFNVEDILTEIQGIKL